MAQITITIPDEHVPLVLEMLKKSSGKTISLSNQYVSPTGSIFYDFKSDDETNLQFSKRAVLSILKGFIKWGIAVKEEHRYAMDLEDAKDALEPITVDMPEDVMT